jgi:murein DD-endopeptidase MepM/ murein hydrolase activator NlpD
MPKDDKFDRFREFQRPDYGTFGQVSPAFARGMPSSMRPGASNNIDLLEAMSNMTMDHYSEPRADDGIGGKRICLVVHYETVPKEDIRDPSVVAVLESQAEAAGGTLTEVLVVYGPVAGGTSSMLTVPIDPTELPDSDPAKSVATDYTRIIRYPRFYATPGMATPTAGNQVYVEFVDKQLQSWGWLLGPVNETSTQVSSRSTSKPTGAQKPFEEASSRAETLEIPDEWQQQPEPDPVCTESVQLEAHIPTFDGCPMIAPIKGFFAVHATYGQGRRAHGGGKTSHKSIDQNVPVGTPLRAIAPGKIGIIRSATARMTGSKFQSLRNAVANDDWANLTIKGKNSNKFFRNDRAHGKGLTADEKKQLLAAADWLQFKKLVKKIFRRDIVSSRWRDAKKAGVAGYKSAGGIGGASVRIAHMDDNGKKWGSYYGHMSVIYVKKGQEVKQGEIIGRTGDTAIFDSKPHLHMQLHSTHAIAKSSRIDPQRYIPELA